MQSPLNPLLDRLSLPMDVVGRVLLGLYFVLPGVMKVVGFAATLAYMQQHGVPFALPLLYLTIPLQIGGGLALIAGWQTRTVAFLLAGLTLLICIYMHDFWNHYEGGSQQHELQNFIKNLGIFEAVRCVASYFWARAKVSVAKLFGRHKPEESLQDWITNRFGKRLFDHFFKTYNENV
jgi:putative oxidoreductase